MRDEPIFCRLINFCKKSVKNLDFVFFIKFELSKPAATRSGRPNPLATKQMKSKFGGLDFGSVEVLSRQQQSRVTGGNGGYPSFWPSPNNGPSYPAPPQGGSGGSPGYSGPPNYGGGSGINGLPPTTIGGVTCPGGTHIYTPSSNPGQSGSYSCG